MTVRAILPAVCACVLAASPAADAIEPLSKGSAACANVVAAKAGASVARLAIRMLRMLVIVVLPSRYRNIVRPLSEAPAAWVPFSHTQ